MIDVSKMLVFQKIFFYDLSIIYFLNNYHFLVFSYLCIAFEKETLVSFTSIDAYTTARLSQLIHIYVIQQIEIYMHLDIKEIICESLLNYNK